MKCVFMSAVLCTNPVKLWLKYCGYYNMIMLQYDNTLTQCSCYPSSPQLLSDTSHRLLIVIQMSAWDQFFWARVCRLWAVAVHRVWSVEMVVSRSRTLITAITITITSSQHQAIHFIGATCDRPPLFRIKTHIYLNHDKILVLVMFSVLHCKIDIGCFEGIMPHMKKCSI